MTVRSRFAPRRSALLPALAMLGPLGLLAAAGPAQARPAFCETTDDGSYPCDFQTEGRDGSFTIRAPGKPTHTLLMTEPGVATGFVRFGGTQSVPLPGLFLRSRTDPGCWVNDQTAARICAR